MYKNFIWDFDGTLVDTDRCIMACYNIVLKEYGIAEKEEKIMQIVKEGSKLKATEYLIDKYKKFTKDEFFEKYDKIDKMPEIYLEAEAIPGAIEICKYIKKLGYKNIIVTNRGENTEEILKKLKMYDLFDFIMFYGKDGVFERKPDIGMFEYVIKKYDLEIKETLSIGDRTLDYLASKKINLPTCMFNARYDKEKIKPEFDIKSLYELKNIIEGKV